MVRARFRPHEPPREQGLSSGCSPSEVSFSSSRLPPGGCVKIMLLLTEHAMHTAGQCCDGKQLLAPALEWTLRASGECSPCPFACGPLCSHSTVEHANGMQVGPSRLHPHLGVTRGSRWQMATTCPRPLHCHPRVQASRARIPTTLPPLLRRSSRLAKSCAILWAWAPPPWTWGPPQGSATWRPSSAAPLPVLTSASSSPSLG